MPPHPYYDAERGMPAVGCDRAVGQIWEMFSDIPRRRGLQPSLCLDSRLPSTSDIRLGPQLELDILQW